jgi:hypothetical protein
VASLCQSYFLTVCASLPYVSTALASVIYALSLACFLIFSRSNTWFIFLNALLNFSRSRGSSGGIVSDYGLDDRAIGVRSPAGAEDFSSILCVQTGSGAHPASCTMGTGGPFPRGKAQPGRDADHSLPPI